MRYLTLVLPLFLLACSTPEQRTAQAAHDYGPRCEKQGFAKDTERWRACVESEDMNAALATQRAYDQDFLRKHDCTDPRAGCGGPAR